MNSLPDPYEIIPLAKPPNCTITVPGSKSITNRALILAALANGTCTLRGALWADDTRVMADSLNKLGIKTIPSKPDENSNCDIRIEGQDGRIPRERAELYVGNAGTAARFLTALVCLGQGEYKILGDERMHERPMKELFDALRSLGATIETTNDHLPATIHAHGLRSGNLTISLEQTSQFLSALLLVSGRIGLNVNASMDSEAESYVTMTRKLKHLFDNPMTSADFAIEPDMSSGSYFVAVNCLFQEQGAKVQVAGWRDLAHPRLQIDSEFPAILEDLFKSSSSSEFPVSRAIHLGDSIMTLAICALFAKQTLRIYDAARLRLQETDRIKAMVTELRKVAGKEVAEETDDGFIVHPADPAKLYDNKPKDIETYNDHRMAMCFSVLGLKVPGIRIKNPQCVSKTFPNFFEKLEQLRQ